MSDVHTVVLAAGKGTRLVSATAKVLHRVAGVPMIEYVLATAAALRPRSTTVVVGHQAESVKAALARHADLAFVVQDPQLGTGHALLAAEAALGGATGTLVLLSGDVPLLSRDTLSRFVAHHRTSGAAATVMTALVADPSGYGRIARSADRIDQIVEDRDATAAEKAIREINSGIYAFELDGLFDAVRAIAAVNAQREYYLPDLVAIYRQRGRGVETMTVPNPDEIRGINSRAELAEVSRIVRQQKNAELMAAGVTIEDPSTTYIDRSVNIAADTIIHPGVSIEGRTTIGTGCEIHSGVRIVDSRIADRVTIFNHCVILAAVVDDNALLGPFAHLRPGVHMGERAQVGNFVELKNTVLGPGSKSRHLSYLGDATIGSHVNVGAGTITCNYDGVTKHRTTIEDGAFIGSDTQLVAPVTVGKGAYVGSGTTLREDVPAGALAVSAGPQRNIEGWVEKKVKKQKEKGQK
ncbi:MAG: bifunctional UDP-N-acetylglucosamine diphosphorylase/glucosamine-1-phosphate N-acetyltransferase GlmU [Vicinamibacterales bacterium]